MEPPIAGNDPAHELVPCTAACTPHSHSCRTLQLDSETLNRLEAFYGVEFDGASLGGWTFGRLGVWILWILLQPPSCPCIHLLL